eukprot:scaffold30372_cov70-Cyclotella_meneghiniana.AAC.5
MPQLKEASELSKYDIMQTPPVAKTIVISGVTSGLGRSLLDYYYLQGHRVAGCGTREREIIQTLQTLYPEARLRVVNVTSDASVEAWINDIICDDGSNNASCSESNRWNVVDIVIANAGISPETKFGNLPGWEVPQTDFDDTIDINVKGVANMMRHFVPRMIDDAMNQRGSYNKSFVAMSSGLGRSPNPFHSAYCASKWAVEGMMKSLAMSLPEPLCAVPLAPGVVQTGMMPGMDGDDNTTSNWVKVAGPMILGFDRNDNGKSLSVDGFYTEQYKNTWIIKDGVGIPDELGYDFADAGVQRILF